MSYKQHQKPRNHLQIPFRYVHGFLVVDVLINERLPLKFIFDTGSKHTILTDKDLVPFLGQDLGEKVKIVGSDLRVPITGRIMRRTSILIGEVDLENQSLIILDKGTLDLSSLTGEDIHGILGIGAFGAYGVRINYQKHIIELIDPKHIQPEKRSTIVPLRIEKSKAYVELDAIIHPGKTQKLSLLLDTGASLSLLIHASKTDSVLYPPKVISGTFGYGLGGYLEGYVGRSNMVKIGSYELPDIITHFQVLSADNSLGDMPTREGIIGNGILDRFIVLIDFHRKELHLSPIKKRQRVVKYDRSGIHFVRDGSRLNKIRVQHVVTGSPANRAGIQAGDELLKIGFLPIAWLRFSRIENMLRARVGKTIRLTFRRQNEVFTKAIVLEELI